MKKMQLSLTISADGKAAVTTLKQVDKQTRQCVVQASRLSKMYEVLKNNLLLLGSSFLSIKETIDLTDNIKQTEARLRMATGTQLQFNQALKESQQISKNARVDFLSTVNLFSRLSTAAQQYGIEQSKISKVTEAVTYGLKLYGASTAEVASVQTQLSQALAEGLGGHVGN